MNKENEKITVVAKLFANLTKYGSSKSKVELPKGSRVENLLNKFDIPYNEINLILIINGRPHQTINTELKDKDVIAIFPPIGGG